MKVFEVVLVGVIVILCVIMITYYIKSKGGVGKFIFGVGSGIATLYLASFALTSMGYILSVNLLTITVSAILGAPGVLLLVGLLIV